jgi:urate oxidase
VELIVRDPNCLVKAYPELTVGFSREDELEICQELISNDYSGYLMENLKKMTRVLPEDYPKIIDIFIKKNKLERLWEYLEKLTGIDPLQYKSILESSVNVNLEVLTKNIHKLKGVDGSEYFETAKKIAERNPEIIKYVNRFAQFNIQERNEILLIAYCARIHIIP